MELPLAILTLALIVAFVVLGPLRRGSEIDRRGDDARAALEAAKEAKYREIKDAELDHQMGKLSDADYQAIDQELRAQAIEILREMDKLGSEVGGRGSEGGSPDLPPPTSDRPRRR